MIHSVTVLDGFPVQLPGIGRKTFKFQKGINILFGPNGCGKTTLLNIAGAYSGTRAGWSTFVDPLYSMDHEYPEAFGKNAPAQVKAKVDWDGTASFLMSPKTGSPAGASLDDSQDGLMDFGMIVGEMAAKVSSGQQRLIRLNRLADVLKSIPDLTKKSKNYSDVNDLWQKAMDKFVKYVKSRTLEGPSTLLLDEVDQSVSIPLQKDFWTIAIPNIAKRFQVIAATHCPFALVHRESPGFVEMEAGYVESCMKAVEFLGAKA